ncbi:MAG: glycosyltransferase family 4 protein [Candidatus Levyibacteriota bacterium]|nr:MAG: glycosyltransferase family 4 protein [Candidatus Levybacteria bacterium]
MRILIFNWRDLKHSWAGGGEIYIFEQASRWVKMGHEVSLFCGQDIEENLPSFEIIDGIKIYRKGGRYNLYLWAIWYYISRFRGKADVVVDVVNGIPFFTPLFCRIPKVSYVYHLHGDQFFYELPFPLSYFGFIVERFVFPFLYKHLSIIVISETTKKQLISIGFNKKNISIVYCGINGSNTIKNSIKKFSAPTILYLGRIKRYKRVDLLVKIFPKIIEKMPQTRLIIAGWGTEASNIANLVMKSPLRRKITLLGPVNDAEKKSLLSKSWLVVNPSIGEGWGMAVIEANLYGTPAVSFNVSGLTESIQNGKTGILAKDEEELINKICEVLNDRTLRETLSKNAIKWSQKFSWAHAAKKSMRTLEKVEMDN